MAQPVCELCGSRDFAKQDGMFVCEGCGTKYTTEEARRLMMEPVVRDEPYAGRGPEERRFQQRDPRDDYRDDRFRDEYRGHAPRQRWEEPERAADFDPQAYQAANQGTRGINNYICLGWQLLLREYQALEHPTKEQQRELADRATECLLILDNSTWSEPDDHVLSLLVYRNCDEIIDSVKNTRYYEQDAEGKWSSHSLPYDVKFTLPGQSESWEDKAAYHRGFLEKEYVSLYPEQWAQRGNLQRQAEDLQADLGDLKDEKRSKGFFNFAEKREVKDRMKPFKEELAQVRSQIRAIDDQVDAFVEDKLKALAANGATRLKF